VASTVRAIAVLGVPEWNVGSLISYLFMLGATALFVAVSAISGLEVRRGSCAGGRILCEDE
jgi:hypothetical protein